jgi:hypothetical protein
VPKIRDLTPQERACFEPVDRQVPGSNLVGIAESVANRVSRETKGKIRRAVDEEIAPLLWALQQEHTTEHHENGHGNLILSSDRLAVAEECFACRIERAIERLGEMTVHP